MFLAVAFCLLVLAAFVRIEVVGDWDGIFLLTRSDGIGLVLTDDIYAEEVGRLLFHVEFEPLWQRYRALRSRVSGRSYLDSEWDEDNGRGFIRNYFPDGTSLIITFGRALDDYGRPYHGLVVGGGLPVTELAAPGVTMNQTGMAFYDGSRWNHLWCTANEGLRLGDDPDEVTAPAEWKFLGSRVLQRTGDRVVIWSGHEAKLGGAPLRVDRRFVYRAGDPYFLLSVSLTNTGGRDVPYFYMYGDEPWVGDYGSSAGDVGWVKDRLIFHEGTVDPARYRYAGMYDFGNPFIAEGHAFTGMADFVEWLGPNIPDMVYFSNDVRRVPEGGTPVPLSSPLSRLLVMQWGPRLLRPGQTATHVMAFGMARTGRGQPVPVKPPVDFDPADAGIGSLQ